MVNQLLAGVHIAAAAEAIALGARAGLDTRLLYDIISKAAGNSWWAPVHTTLLPRSICVFKSCSGRL